MSEFITWDEIRSDRKHFMKLAKSLILFKEGMMSKVKTDKGYPRTATEVMLKSEDEIVAKLLELPKDAVGILFYKLGSFNPQQLMTLKIKAKVWAIGVKYSVDDVKYVSLNKSEV